MYSHGNARVTEEKDTLLRNYLFFLSFMERFLLIIQQFQRMAKSTHAPDSVYF